MLIIKKLWNFFLIMIKSKWFWFILLGLLLLFYFNKNRNKKLEIERLQNNNVVLNQSVKQLKTKNGELYYSVNALTLKKDEFYDSNQELSKRLKDMGIKLKNVQSINELNIKYANKYDRIDSEPIFITDTLYIPTVSNTESNLVNYFTKYSFENISNDMSISGIINIPIGYDSETKLSIFNKNLNPYLSDTKIVISDTLTIVPTINYKRVLIFFKRPKSVTVFVKSENKLFQLEQMKTYQITK